MKKINTLVLICFVLFVGACGKGEFDTTKFNGIWSDCSNSNFDNCYAVFSQVGDSIHMGHYIEFKGQPFFESGSGIVKGDSIIYNVKVIKPIRAWGLDGGTHYLKLSDDKNTLEGIFITEGGNKGSLIFKRR